MAPQAAAWTTADHHKHLVYLPSRHHAFKTGNGGQCQPWLRWTRALSVKQGKSFRTSFMAESTYKARCYDEC